jgi:hypothetical protein
MLLQLRTLIGPFIQDNLYAHKNTFSDVIKTEKNYRQHKQ